jgi:hypothetical protein
VNEAIGTFACPICGYDKPHSHDDAVVAAYREDQIRNDGWISAIKQLPTKSGWFLCLGIEVAADQRGKPAHFDDYRPQWSQLSWFKWVREGAARDVEARVPEVLYWDHIYSTWSLRNLLGNAVPSGEDVRWRVLASPRYWRDVPPLGSAHPTSTERT